MCVCIRPASVEHIILSMLMFLTEIILLHQKTTGTASRGCMDGDSGLELGYIKIILIMGRERWLLVLLLLLFVVVLLLQFAICCTARCFMSPNRGSIEPIIAVAHLYM